MFTPMCLCHQDGQFGTSQTAMILCTLEGNYCVMDPPTSSMV